MEIKLTPENYEDGYLIDEEWMAGIYKKTLASPKPHHQYEAFVINHQTGEPLGSKVFSHLNDALMILNHLNREWRFESFSECGNGSCGKTAQCGTQCCPKKQKKMAHSHEAAPPHPHHLTN